MINDGGGDHVKKNYENYIFSFPLQRVVTADKPLANNNMTRYTNI